MMAILENEILINASPRNQKYLEDLGYDIPKYIDKKGKPAVKTGTKIMVKVEDLPINSTEEITKICDGCGAHTPNYVYRNIAKNRSRRKSNYDLCQKCLMLERYNDRSKNIPYEDTLWATNPDVASLLKDKNAGYTRTHGSSKKEVFICDDCGYEEEKKVHNVVKYGLRCRKCSDGMSYPEKYVYNILNQLKIEFDYRKKFHWSFNKEYDFYIPSLKCIVETHGGQHYGHGFNTINSRTLQEEKQNDKFKENIAIKNGIVNYIVIDCRESLSDFIKNSVVNSRLNNNLDNGLFDLSNIIWNECHEFALNSLVKNACALWNDKIKNSNEIGIILGISRHSVIRYLKKGTEIGWCIYDPKEAQRENIKQVTEQLKMKVIQMTLDGSFISEYDSLNNAAHLTGIHPSKISLVCRGQRNKTGGFRWMFKDDYEKNKNAIEPIRHKSSKKVVQLSLKGELIKEWDSISQVRNSLGNGHSGNVTSVCKGYRKSSYGFKWMYKEDYESMFVAQNKSKLPV